MITIETLLPWSAPREVQTKFGPRRLRKAEPTETFWLYWRDEQAALKAAGISLGKDQRTGAWEVLWWAKLDSAEVEARQASAELSRAAASDFEPPCPEGLRFYPFQKAGIDFMRRRAATLLADDMGIGKTIQAIGLINCTPEIKRVLVVTKASLKENWRREMRKWLVRPMELGIATGQHWPSHAAVVIVNYDVLSKWPKKLHAEPWDLIILDESAAIKNRDAKRTVAIIGRTARPSKGLEAIPAIPAVRRLCLSGTPMENRPEELWTTLYFLDPQTWGSFWAYARRYCGMTSNGYGVDTSGATNLDELQRRLRETIMIRRRKTEVLTELPPKTRIVVEMDTEGLEDSIEEEGRTMERFRTDLEHAQAQIELARAGESDEAFKSAVKRLASSTVAFTEMAKARHATAMRKVPRLIEALTDDLKECSKVLVFCCHHDVIDAVSKVLNEYLSRTTNRPLDSSSNRPETSSAGSLSVPVPMRRGSSRQSQLVETTESRVLPLQDAEGQKSSRPEIRQMDSSGADQPSVSVDMVAVPLPVRSGQTGDSGNVAQRQIQGLPVLSSQKTRSILHTTVPDAGASQTACQSEQDSFSADNERPHSAESVSVIGHSDPVRAQQSSPNQSVTGPNQTGVGLRPRECLDHQLARQCDKAQCEPGRVGNDHSQSASKNLQHVAVIDGRTPVDMRQAIVDRFQTDPVCRVFVGGIRACGEGITLTAANLVVFGEEDWVPGKVSQAEDRAHRIGQKDNILVKHYVLPGTIDARMIQTIVAKQEVIDRALDTDPGEWATEPVFVPRHEPIGKRREIQEEALLITSGQRTAISAALVRLAGMCDGAQAIDGHGFNKIDTMIGHELATLPALTMRQAALGRRICRKYVRQLGEEAVKAMG